MEYDHAKSKRPSWRFTAWRFTAQTPTCQVLLSVETRPTLLDGLLMLTKTRRCDDHLLSDLPRFLMKILTFCPPRAAQDRPRAPPERPETAQDEPRSPPNRPKTAQDEPRSPQDRPKTASTGPMSGQDDLRSHQDRSKFVARSLQDRPSPPHDRP